MFPNMHKYMKANHGNLLEIEVAQDEFIKMMIASGETQAKAEFSAKMSLALGASVMIGEQMVKIKQDSPKENQ